MIRRLFISVVVLLISISPAWAHTSLSTSTPNEGEVLTALPAQIELTFNEPIMKVGSKEVSQLLLRDPDNALVDLGEVLSNGQNVSAKILGKTSASGLYKIYYRVVAEDGHPISGQINFSIGKKDLSAQGKEIAPIKSEGSSLLFAGIVALIATVLSFLMWRRRSNK
ncbi:MAG: hypothetical protein RL301_651 [Actinomycetota bacterium]